MTVAAENMTAYNGHPETCLCPMCMVADMTAFIRSTRTAQDADRLIAELGTISEKVKSERTRFAKPGQRAGRGYVRKISDKQKWFIGKLLKERDFTSLLAKKWFTTDVANISLAGAKTIITELLECPVRPAIEIEALERMAPAMMITERQVSYIVSLMRQSEITGTVFDGKTEDDVKRLTKEGARKAIDMLKTLPKRKALTATTKDEVKEIAGIYELDGEIYRMKRARGKTHFYAMILDREAGDAWHYAEGMARRVPTEGRKLSLEECEALSVRTGGCCMCGAQLTATVNGVGPAARYIGPKCEANMGF